jgi:hypothetical protein
VNTWSNFSKKLSAKSGADPVGKDIGISVEVIGVDTGFFSFLVVIFSNFYILCCFD